VNVPGLEHVFTSKNMPDMLARVGNHPKILINRLGPLYILGVLNNRPRLFLPLLLSSYSPVAYCNLLLRSSKERKDPRLSVGCNSAGSMADLQILGDNEQSTEASASHSTRRYMDPFTLEEALHRATRIEVV